MKSPELIETENIIIKGYLPVDERLQSRLDCLNAGRFGEYFRLLADLSLAEI